MGKITLFKSLKTMNNPYEVDIDFVLDRIKNGHQKELVEKIRPLKTKEERNPLKKHLNAILFAGTFGYRNAKNLIAHSGYICADFDDMETEEKMKSFYDFITKDKYTHVVFLSPSGNGYKVVIKIPTRDHKGSFLALEEYYTEKGWGKYFGHGLGHGHGFPHAG